MKRVKINAIVMALLTLCVNFAEGQKIIELNRDLSGGTENYEASWCIKLKNGFSYSADATASFTGKVNSNLIFPPTSNTFANSQGEIVSRSSEGAVVGAIPSQFSVSQTGAAGYTIPVDVPKGIKGVQPNVSLVYNSHAGRGIAGLGWNISGISAISRAKSSMYYDAVESDIVWDNTSPLSLDGQRLIKIRESNGEVEYRTENESFSKIVGYDIQSWGPKYFKVFTKEGQILTYGNYQNLASYSPAFSNVSTDALSETNYQRVAWNLVNIEDCNGNYISYEYACSFGGYVGNVLRRISYGANTVAGTSAPISIEFNYESRSDILKGFISGYENLSQLRLHSIEVLVNGQEQKLYTLNYSTDNLSKLLSVDLTKSGRRIFNPIVLSYGDNDIPESSIDISYIKNDVNNQPKKNLGLVVMDFDGDGVNELGDVYTQENQQLAGLVSTTIEIRKKENNWATTSTSICFPLSISYFDAQRGLQGCFGDFNGNGSVETLSAFREGTALFLTIRDKKNDQMIYDGTQVTAYSNQDPFIITGNLYGKAISDAIIILNNPVLEGGMFKYPYFVIRGNSSSNPNRLPSSSTSYYYLYSPYKIQSAELSNLQSHNLRSDLWLNCEGGHVLLLKNNFSVTDCFSYSDKQYFTLPFQLSETDIHCIADLNSDGMGDIVYRKNSNDWYIAYNKGGLSFVINTLPINCSRQYGQLTNGEVSKDDVLQILDINNDGKLDIVVGDEKIVTISGGWGSGTFLEGTTWRFYLNTNSGFVLSREVESKKECRYSCFGDLKSNGTLCWIYANSTGDVKLVDFGYDYRQKSLIKIKDALNCELNINYKTLAECKDLNGANQVDANGNTWNNQQYLSSNVMPFISTGMLLVSDYQQGVIHKSYDYGKALYHWPNRGFIGFQYNLEKDETSGVCNLFMNKPYGIYGLLLPEKTTTSMGVSISNGCMSPINVLSSQEFKYNITNCGLNRYLLQQSEIVEYNILLDQTRHKYFSYDEYNNPTSLLSGEILP